MVKYQLRDKIICEETGKELICETLDVAGGSVRGKGVRCTGDLSVDRRERPEGVSGKSRHVPLR